MEEAKGETMAKKNTILVSPEVTPVFEFSFTLLNFKYQRRRDLDDDFDI